MKWWNVVTCLEPKMSNKPIVTYRNCKGLNCNALQAFTREHRTEQLGTVPHNANKTKHHVTAYCHIWVEIMLSDHMPIFREWSTRHTSLLFPLYDCPLFFFIFYGSGSDPSQLEPEMLLIECFFSERLSTGFKLDGCERWVTFKDNLTLVLLKYQIM